MKYNLPLNAFQCNLAEEIRDMWVAVTARFRSAM